MKEKSNCQSYFIFIVFRKRNSNQTSPPRRYHHPPNRPSTAAAPLCPPFHLLPLGFLHQKFFKTEEEVRHTTKNQSGKNFPFLQSLSDTVSDKDQEPVGQSGESESGKIFFKILKIERRKRNWSKLS